MFSSSFTMSEQKHRQWTPYKHDAPDTVESVKPHWIGASELGQSQRKVRSLLALLGNGDRKLRIRCVDSPRGRPAYWTKVRLCLTSVF